ncbi:hypothetical protein Ahy_A07g034176 isoform C [Arachis hypogaea]|uniref:Uncharacterized protein n=1 Tax=Arachis hypogaea TaxID=3818 RepID=A0A445CB96_ARAHY|nr:hypothetical protein Ahy_A07g034176 isoform C [Arachis hypogaea]
MPATSESLSFSKPLQGDGNGFLLSNLAGEITTACSLHFLLLSSYSLRTINLKQPLTKSVKHTYRIKNIFDGRTNFHFLLKLMYVKFPLWNKGEKVSGS